MLGSPQGAALFPLLALLQAVDPVLAGAADETHKHAGEPLEGLEAAHGAEGDHQAQGQRARQSHEEQAQRLPKALVEGADNDGHLFGHLLQQLLHNKPTFL